MSPGLVVRLLVAVVVDLVAAAAAGVAVLEAVRPGRHEPERWARMAGVSPAAAAALVDLVEVDRTLRQVWPCCVHCDGVAGARLDGSVFGSCPAGDRHLEPCVELVEYPGLDGDPRPRPCQAGP